MPFFSSVRCSVDNEVVESRSNGLRIAAVHHNPNPSDKDAVEPHVALSSARIKFI